MTTKALKKSISVFSNKEILEREGKYSMNLVLQTAYVLSHLRSRNLFQNLTT